MRGSRIANGELRAALTLILLLASIFAPFRTSRGRVPLNELGRDVAGRSSTRTQAVARVAALPSRGVVVAVGRAFGGGEPPLAVVPGFFPTRGTIPGPVEPSASLPRLHLRC